MLKIYTWSKLNIIGDDINGFTFIPNFLFCSFFNFVAFQVAFLTIEVSSWNAAEIANIKPEDYIILSQRDQTLQKSCWKEKGGKWVKT